ncbi:MAG: (2Fe-2S)-binding protein, partial [Rhodospirillales bacterium]|nr:(2Fe-2S)-binding protein [Rhodospirillales bacterium]
MSGSFRLPEGGRIDRQDPRYFTFDGRRYQGFAGDTLASALIANGVHLVGRSYKYHRPRGILSAGAEEPNALVGISDGPGRFTPNLRATQVELTDGLVATSQNRYPSLRFDLGAINTVLAPLFGAGFYYKTFMGPDLFGRNWAWKHVYEPVIRRAAGLGAAPTEPDPDAYAQFYDHCDVLVIGGGPAGLAAALAAAAGGGRVVLCDEQAEPGGSLLGETRATIDGRAARDWLAATLADLAARPNVTLMPRTQAFGYYAQNFLGLCETVAAAEATSRAGAPRERLWQMRAAEVVLACGAIERPLVFPDNDRPGVMLADSARTYLNRYGAKVGARVVIATAHDSAYRAALDLAAAGTDIVRVADLRETAEGELPRAARRAGIVTVTGARVAGVRGAQRVHGVGIAAAGRVDWLACDALLMSGGWTPSVHLHSQSRGKVEWDAEPQMFLPGASVQRARSAGACRGTLGLAAALHEGAAAGAEAARMAGFPATACGFVVEGAPDATGGMLGDTSAPGARRAKAFVDYQNDVCASDIRLAVQEGMHAIEHVKRYTTTGMATDQGKLSNMNALAIVARARD